MLGNATSKTLAGFVYLRRDSVYIFPTVEGVRPGQHWGHGRTALGRADGHGSVHHAGLHLRSQFSVTTSLK